jgi:hypothetical protein
MVGDEGAQGERMNAVIHYHPDGYTSNGPKLMGRNAAGEAFLRGFLTHSSSQEFWAQADAPEHAAQFLDTVKRHQPMASAQVVPRSNISRLSNVGVRDQILLILHISEPVLGTDLGAFVE